MNLYEKLNRLDDSLVASKRVVETKKLTESLAANEYEVIYHLNSAGRDRRPETTEDVLDDWKTVVFRADSDLDAWKEAFKRVTGDYYDDFLDENATEDDFSSYFEDSDWGDGSPILIKLSSAESILYDTGYTQESWIEEYVEETDHDDDIEEMLTETSSFKSGDRYYGGLPSEPSMSEYGRAMDAARKNRDALLDKYDIKVDNDSSKGYTTYTGTVNGHTFKYVEGQRDFSRWLSELVIDNKTVDPYKSSVNNIRKMFETNAVSITDIVDLLLKDNFDNIVYKESLTENRWNPYFTPYGYKDAAKVLNGKAPEYYYHLKEIEMDRGDGVRLARYAMRKGFPVMVDKNSDPDYPEFAIKGEYHWNDYFYPYPTAHEDNLIPWDGKMFTEQSLTEESEDVTFDSIANKIVDYAEKHPETLSNMKYVYDYIDNLNQEGIWYIPAALGDFVADDVNNITEDEAEEFIDMLMHKTDVNSRLIKLKKSKSQSAWSKLRDKFPTL